MGGGKINGKEKDAADTILFKAEALRFKDDSDGYRILEGVARRQGGPVPESGQEVPDVPFHITVKGTLPDISVGDEMYSYGRKGTDPKYGQFWQSYGYVKCMPMTVSGIQNYLSHGAIPGINKVRAKKLTAAFGDKTLEVLLKEPERMMSIPGIGKKTYEKIKRSAKEVLGRQSIIQAVMRFIQGVGISPAYAQRICDRYEEKSMDVLQNNPYQLAEDIRGIGFLKADAIAMKVGIQADSPRRMEGAVMYALNRMQDDGHCYGTREGIQKKMHTELLKSDAPPVSPAGLNTAIDTLIGNGRLVTRGTDIYLPKPYKAESSASKYFSELAAADGHCFPVTAEDMERLELMFQEQVKKQEKEEDDDDDGDEKVTYSKEQKAAIRMACSSSVSIITGGPGTGKTTVIKSIITLCKRHGLSVACAAPTGKAAKRMAQSTGERSAQTVHKLLQYSYDEDLKLLSFKYDENEPLCVDVAVIDEASMLDIFLFDALVRALRKGTKLILVGDVDQLPSVGCGNVLRDVISSGTVPVTYLTVIHRQKKKNSQIIDDAHRINEGKMPDLIRANRTGRGIDGDFYFASTRQQRDDPTVTRDRIVQYVCDSIPKNFAPVKENGDDHPDIRDQIQVLSPMRKGTLGVDELNNFIQARLHKKGDKVYTRGGSKFYVGDRIMCVKNDYNYGIFNGDIGKITDIVSECDDDDDEMPYFVFSMEQEAPKKLPLDKLRDFRLAYAMTIHKSQGSEYPYVLMVMTWQHYIMLHRNLLYTGITRAKKALFLIADEKAVQRAVSSNPAIERNTHLKDLLQAAIGKKQCA